MGPPRLNNGPVGIFSQRQPPTGPHCASAQLCDESERFPREPPARHSYSSAGPTARPASLTAASVLRVTTRTGQSKFQEVPTRGYYPRIIAEVRQVFQYDKTMAQTPRRLTQHHDDSVTVTSRTLPPPSMVAPPKTPPWNPVYDSPRTVKEQATAAQIVHEWHARPRNTQ